ncbi:SUMO-activating enzyme subunit 1 isoform X8 [Agelaius tricolor]|uniref:SUMO-activating enzyme subunit 1 isoform X1 n=1 Tax=Agelaius tricolor TaxID=9191 RepID=UPI0039F18C6B
MVEKDESSPGGISEEEAAQYDRQIRLWGLEAQKRLRASRVLLVGLRGLGAEVAKNLILAGVRGVTLLDHQQVSPQDSRAQFLIPAGSLGRNRAEASLARAQSLNPMVEVRADPESVESKGHEFFTQFDAVCLTCCSKESMVRINQICHKNGIKFFTGDVFGYHGFMFADLGQHEFVEEKPKVAKASAGLEDGPEAKRARLEAAETTMVKKQLQFCRLREALAGPARGQEVALRRTAPDYFLLHVLLQFRSQAGRDPCPLSVPQDSALLLRLRQEVLEALGVEPQLLPEQFHSSCFSEMAPVCAVLGGVLGQEVVKALSHRDPPHNNFFFFDGVRGQGLVERLGPPPK